MHCILPSRIVLIIVCILIFNSIKEDDNETSNDKNINPQQEQAVQSNPIAIEKIFLIAAETSTPFTSFECDV